MSTSLATLKSKLQGYIQTVNGRPTDDQYEDAVKLAVTAFNGKVSAIDEATIAVVSGTATYSLPVDFLGFIRLEKIGYDNTVVQPGGLLIPLSAYADPERTTIRGLTMTIRPSPTYTADRILRYKAGHVLESGSYPYMTDEVASVVLVKAKAEVLRLLSTDTPAAGFKYQVGDFMVDKSGVGRSFGEVISKFDGEFERLTDGMGGPAGMRSTYSAAEQAAFEAI